MSTETQPAYKTIGKLTGWAALGVVLLFYILSYLDRTLLSLMVEPIQASLKISDTQIGLLQGASFALFYAFVGLPVGWAVDRYSRRWIIFIGVVVWSISTACCGLARSFLSLGLARAGVGAGEATLAPAAFSLMPEWFPRKRLAAAIGVYYMGSNLGASLALFIGGVTIASIDKSKGLTLPGVGLLETWQTVFIVLGAPGVLLAFLVFLVRERIGSRVAGVEVAQAATWGEFFQFFRRRRAVVICHLVGFPLLALAILALGAWSPAYMGRQFGWEPAQIGPVLAASGLLGMVFNVGLGIAADTLFTRGVHDSYYRVQIWATLASLPFTILAFTTTGPYAFATYLAISMGFLSFGGPSVAALQLIAPVRMRGRLSAIYLLLIALIGTNLGPLIPGLLNDHVFHDRAQLGHSLLIVVCSVSVVAVAFLTFGLKHLRAALTDKDAAIGAEA